MRIHYLQHVPFEDLANIKVWARLKKYPVTATRLYRDKNFPDLNTFDWLIVMGGPMNIYEEERYPWLRNEKEFLKRTIEEGKVVLGICLGAQLLADVLGGEVLKNDYREIGWFPVKKTREANKVSLLNNLPDSFTAFHWHGDTFTIPPGARRIAESAGCKNQAFVYGGKVVGLQFHLESSRGSIAKLINNCSSEIVEGKYIQNIDDLYGNEKYLTNLEHFLHEFLNNLEGMK